MSHLAPRTHLLTLLHIHFEGLVDLVDRRWAGDLDLARSRFDCREEEGLLHAEIPAPSGAPRTLLLRVPPDGESREAGERALLDAYLDLFLAQRAPGRLLAVRAGGARPAVHRRAIVDRAPGQPLLRLPYLAVELGPWLPHLTWVSRAGNLRPFRTPFRRDPPCNSVSLDCPSRERRLCSIR